MRLRYLPTAELGLRWMRRYYRGNPQLNLRAVAAALAQAEQTLVAFPDAGEVYEDSERVREYHIRATPFALLYTVSDGSILVIDVRDTRGQRSASVVREFVRTLRLHDPSEN